MKKILHILTVVALMTDAAIPFAPIVQAKAVFSDIATSPYKTSIEYVAENGGVTGYPDGTFKPSNTINRAELATILVSTKVDFEAIQDKKNCFKDVKEQWFAPYVCYAKEVGIVAGYSDNTFHPEAPVKMAEADVMAMKRFSFVSSLRSELAEPDSSLVRARPVGSPAKPTVTDNSPWYRPYIDFVHNNTPLSKFASLYSRDMRREEAAVLMHRFYLLKAGTEPIVTQAHHTSLGCGKIPPSVTPTSSTINGVARNYITVVPSNYNKDTPIKLVFAFHGRTNSNAEVQRYYGIERAARSEGDSAIFIYPAGLRTASGTGFTWSNPGDSADNLRDFALFDRLLKEFSNNYCINTDQVYVVGHSLGAWFTNSLACARGNVIRAIGSVGGGTTTGHCTGPVAALIMHNPKDNLVPISQGLLARNQLIVQNQCSTTSVPTPPTALSCRAYKECAQYAPFTWCEHHEDTAYWDGSYYPHTWPKSAGAEIWKFFKSLES